MLKSLEAVLSEKSTKVIPVSLLIQSGKHITTKEQVAIKLVSQLLCLFLQEPIKTQFPQLEYEHKLYKVLKGGSKSNCNNFIFKTAGIPDTYWYGVEGDYKCLVMELLG